jgi:hypothetical protein
LDVLLPGRRVRAILKMGARRILTNTIDIRRIHGVIDVAASARDLETQQPEQQLRRQRDFEAVEPQYGGKQ